MSKHATGLDLRRGKNMPAISVITVVRDCAHHLAQCLDSVHSQRGVSWEHIVIDGGSTDGSADVIRERRQKLAYSVSEPDFGIADAMNKGIAHARGDWCLFLHADDYLLEEQALARCYSTVDNVAAEIVGFPIRYGKERHNRLLYPRGGGWWLNLKTGFLHQACFIRRTLFQRLGGYDTRFNIAMDYEFFLRARRQRTSFAIDKNYAPTLMRDCGISSRTDIDSLRGRFAEERAIHLLHATGSHARKAYAFYWALYPFYLRFKS